MMDIFELLDKLNIKYELMKHKAVYTVDEFLDLKEKMIDGNGCKNLFLTDKNDNYFIYVLPENKKADLKSLQKFLQVKKITFGNEDKLLELLGLIKGSVTPLGIINDLNKQVKVIIDGELVSKKVLVHPNVNTMTISLEYTDLIKIIEYLDHEYIIF